MSECQDLGRLLACCGHLGRQYGENLLRQRGYDVTPVQTRMLVYLSRCQSEVNQRDLERELRLRPSTVNGIVSRLEEKGYIARRTSPTDGRVRLVSLREAGRLPFHPGGSQPAVRRHPDGGGAGAAGRSALPYYHRLRK